MVQSMPESGLFGFSVDCFSELMIQLITIIHYIEGSVSNYQTSLTATVLTPVNCCQTLFTELL